MADTSEASFVRFQLMSTELRRMVWNETLSPLAHWFDVYTNAGKFGVYPSKVEPDSGYRLVYALLATCHEARQIVMEYYRCSDFRSFDWIPTGDLVLLRFPPIPTAATLPPSKLILGQKQRTVGVFLPQPLWLDPSQVYYQGSSSLDHYSVPHGSRLPRGLLVDFLSSQELSAGWARAIYLFIEDLGVEVPCEVRYPIPRLDGGFRWSIGASPARFSLGVPELEREAWSLWSSRYFLASPATGDQVPIDLGPVTSCALGIASWYERKKWGELERAGICGSVALVDDDDIVATRYDSDSVVAEPDEDDLSMLEDSTED